MRPRPASRCRADRREARGAGEQRRKSLHEVDGARGRVLRGALQGRRRRARRGDYLARPRPRRRDRSARFRIGYAPAERFALRDHLAGKGVPAELMIEAGLLVSGEDVPVPYDRFRDRVMFPIADARGRVVAFGGRAMSADVPAKYLNSPDTPLFHKGRLLYNHPPRPQARARARHDHRRRGLCRRHRAWRMAGFAERRRAARHGADRGPARAALAHGRRADPLLRRRQGRAPRRLPRRSTWRCRSSSAGKSLRFALLPDGPGPGRPRPLGRRRGGRAGARRRRGPLVDMLWAREIEAGPLDTPERRAALERRLREALSAIRDETLRRYYRDEIEERLRG